MEPVSGIGSVPAEVGAWLAAQVLRMHAVPAEPENDPLSRRACRRGLMTRPMGQRLADTSSSAVRGVRRGLAEPSGPYPRRMSICT